MVRKIHQAQKDKTILFHSYGVAKGVKFIERKQRGGAGEERRGSCCLVRTEIL